MQTLISWALFVIAASMYLHLLTYLRAKGKSSNNGQSTKEYTMNFQLTGAQVQIVGIEDASGNQAPAGTTPFVFSTSDSTIATVASTAPSGLQAQIATSGKPGVVTISATDGTHNVSATLTVLFDESGLQIAPIGAAQPVPTAPAATATPTPTPTPTPAPAATPTPTPGS